MEPSINVIRVICLDHTENQIREPNQQTDQHGHLQPSTRYHPFITWHRDVLALACTSGASVV